MANTGPRLRIGYSRLPQDSTESQLTAAKRQLSAKGCRATYVEALAVNETSRPELELAIDGLRPDGVLVVQSLDRLATGLEDLISIWHRIRAAGAILEVVEVELDSSKPDSRAFLDRLELALIFQRRLLREKRNEAVTRTRAQGNAPGPDPTAKRHRDEIWRLRYGPEKLAISQIAARFSISERSVYRVLQQAQQMESGD